jgi:hypothetical protein
MKAKAAKIASTDRAPNGLHEARVDDLQLVEQAREEVEQLLQTVLLGQIASNQHCYIHLPHPLAASNNRENSVPCLKFGDERVVALEKLFAVSMATLGVKGSDFDEFK